MNLTRSIAVSVASLLALSSPMPGINAQSPPPTQAPKPVSQATPPAVAAATPRERPQKSVYGKLESLVPTRNAVVMRSDAGERLAWKFDAAVITEMEKFKPGAPMIVIYRQVSPGEKRVTAVAFPGTASTPTYINMTGWRVTLRSAPMEGGVCSQIPGGVATESVLPVGGRAEVLDACWCCAPAGEACTPGNKSGLGQALLVRCFQ